MLVMYIAPYVIVSALAKYVISTLFTKIAKTNGVKVLIPNNAIIGGKVYLKPKQQ
ncbi:MAG: hypothetical protein QXJ00_06865 [Candidatus Nezhaarchaeales archaeon]